ncbi:MAG: hypothetical protein R3F46_00905 [bacterium]
MRNISASSMMAQLAVLLLAMSMAAHAAQPEMQTASELRPLDDPANPYLGQYEEWDVWAHEHHRPDITSHNELFSEFPAGTPPQAADNGMQKRHLELPVDAAGWQIPWRIYQQRIQQAKLDGISFEDLPRERTLFAAGLISPQLWQQREQVRIDLRAAALPPIPAWLGQDPPLELQFMPDGEFVARGRLGLVPHNMRPVDCLKLGRDERWYRYSAQGELLGRSDYYFPGMLDSNWMYIYWPGLEQLTYDMQAQGLEPWTHGRCVFFGRPQSEWDSPGDAEPGYFSRCFNYLGEEQDVTEAWQSADRLADLRLFGNDVREIHQTQLRQGIAVAQDTSRFEGLANGPVRVRPDDSRPMLARRSALADWQLSMVEIRPLDDPDNPWRGQYSEWDLLCIGAFSRGEEPLQELYALKRASLLGEEMAMPRPGMTLDELKDMDTVTLSSEEISEQRIVSLSNHVSRDGWLVPDSVATELNLIIRQGERERQDLRSNEFLAEISVHVRLDEAAYLRYEAWQSERNVALRLKPAS